MKLLFSFLIVCLFMSCQKDNSEPTTPDNVLFDSIVGDWKYSYDYRLVATQAAPDVIIDSVFTGDYAPLSYFKISADSTYKWWRTAMQTLPAVGYGVTGKLGIIQSTRTMRWTETAETTNDFATQTAINPVRYSPEYKIKFLSSDSMVCTFRVIGPDDNFWYWHDVYVK